MAIYKCKLCGGALDIDGGQSVTTCQYCGTKQTLPRLDDDKKINLYDRASHFLRNNDFDKAMSIYELILNEDKTDAESYWSILLCKYGIEYIEDPDTHRSVPTVHRAQYTSIFEDEDYKSAILHADESQRELYEKEARQINEIQKRYLAISQSEEPFDVFICYKETDSNGKRTRDSVLASELYTALSKEGYKVFFAKITLENKLGIAYEPYIFSALNTSRAMVVLGTKKEYFEAAWVKNEWSRFLSLIKNGAEKTLIPAYRDMDPYDLPEEFSHLQALDMSKIGFLQDLVLGIKKLVGEKGERAKATEPIIISGGMSVAPLLRRVQMAIEDGEMAEADAFCEQALNQDPENAQAYVYKLIISLNLKRKEELATRDFLISENIYFKKAMRFANEELKKELLEYDLQCKGNIENKQRLAIYQKAIVIMNQPSSPKALLDAKALFEEIKGFNDADEKAVECGKMAQELFLRLQKEEKERQRQREIARQKRKEALTKIRKISLITLIVLLIIAVISFAVYFVIAHIVTPNNLYDEAMALAEENEYEKAINKLRLASSRAVFKGDIEKYNEQIQALETAIKLEADRLEAERLAEEQRLEAERLAEEQRLEAERLATEKENELQSSASGATVISNGEYERIIKELLNGGISVTVVYNGEGFDENVKAYTKESFTAIESVSRVGYKLAGWVYDEYSYNGEKREVTLGLTASWQAESYNITYELNGGKLSNAVSSYNIETDTFTLGIPEKYGREFIGWVGDGYSEPTMYVTVPKGSYGHRRYFARWRDCSYELTFDTNGADENVENMTVTYGQPFTLPSVTRYGYTFLGWYTENGEKMYDASWSYDKGMRLAAKWTPTEYKINYMLGIVNEAANVNKSTFNIETEVELFDLSHDGCSFEGWYSDSDFTSKITCVPKGTVGDITVYAKWTVHKYTVTYNLNGGLEGEGEYLLEFTYKDLPIFLPSPTKEGCTFYYWSANDRNGKIVRSINTCESHALYANYCTDGVSFEGRYGAYGDYYGAIYKDTANIEELEIPKYSMDGRLIDGLEEIVSSSVKRIVLSDGIKALRPTCITHCPALEYIEFTGNGLEKIYSWAIFDCPSLKTVIIPDSLSYCNLEFSDFEGIEYNVYKNGRYLGNGENPYVVFAGPVNTDEQVTELHPDTRVISAYSFYNNNRIYSLVIPEGVVGVSQYAFIGCNNLLEIYNLSSFDVGSVVKNACIHNSLDEPSIVIKDENGFLFRLYNTGEYKLMGYIGTQKDIALPSTILGNAYNIGDYAFYGCDLSGIVIPEGVKSIASYAFAESRISSITIPASVETIDAYAFYGSSVAEVYNLSALDISGLDCLKDARCIHTTLEESCIIADGDYIFHHNKAEDTYELIRYVGSGTEITLPMSINGYSYKIGYDAFNGASTVTSITLSQGIYEIGKHAFRACEKLERVVISSSVKKIGGYIFADCDNITYVKFEQTEGWSAVKADEQGNEVKENINAEQLADEQTACRYLYNTLFYYLPWVFTPANE